MMLGKQKDSLILILGVRSGSVGATVFKHNQDGKPELIFSERKNVPIENDFHFEIALGHVARAMNELLRNVQVNLKGRRPEQVHVVLGTPWYLAQNRRTNWKGGDEIVCSKKFVDRLLTEEAHLFTLEHFQDREVEIIERTVGEVILNGYICKDPIGKSAKEIDFSFSISASEKSLLEQTRNIIHTFYHNRDISFHSFSKVCLGAIKMGPLADVPSFMLADIGGEVSELTLMEDNMVSENVSFPLGAHTIIRDLAKSYSISTDEARSLIEASQIDRVSAEVRKHIDKVRDGVRLKWVTYLAGIIESFSNKHLLPPLFVIVGQPESSNLFSQALQSKEIEQIAGNASAGKCLTINMSELKNFYTVAEMGSRVKPDSLLVIEAIYFNMHNGGNDGQ